MTPEEKQEFVNLLTEKTTPFKITLRIGDKQEMNMDSTTEFIGTILTKEFIQALFGEIISA